MPQPQKQKPTGNSKPTPTQTSKSNDTAWDLVDTIRLLLYGASGSGKTTTWATFPGPIKALIVSGGSKPGELRSINTAEYRQKIYPYVVNTIEELKGHLENANTYATVVLDHVSGLQDLILKELLGLDEIPVQKSWGIATQQQYGQCTMMAKEYLRTMLNLPGNVVIIAQERTFGGKDDGIDGDLIKPTVGAAVTPSLAGWLNPACDYVVQSFKRPRMIETKLEANGKTITQKTRAKGVEYCLRTEPHDVYMTKFRIPRGKALPEVLVLGNSITGAEKVSAYEKIMEVIKG